MFADLHCHPANRPFNLIRNSPRDPWLNPPSGSLATDQTIWFVDPNDVKEKRKQLEGGFTGQMAAFPQCDLKSLTDSDTRIVFAALYPIEKGFFLGNSRKGIGSGVFSALATRLMTQGNVRWLGPVFKPIARFFNPLLSLLINNKGPGRDFLQGMMMRLSKDRINFLQSDDYDYYTELQHEYNFFVHGNGQTPPAGTNVKRYRIVVDQNNLQKIISHSDDIAIVLTLEGMHMLSQKFDQRSKKLVYVEWDELKERIDTIKTWNVFFVTFSHHYNNELAGHARSLPQLMQEISDQVPLRHEGFKQDGCRAIKRLLSIDSNNQRDSSLGKRVLIDLKHMAAKARKEYYAFVQDYNAHHPSDAIPVVASHVGYANRKTLDELILHAENENDDSFTNSFYQWNINLCDEEVRIIVESGGIIGLSFDQRIVGIDLATKPSTDKDWSWFLANNIMAFVRACVDSTMSQPYRVWDCIGLGTDFDGYVDPVNPFGTAERFGHCMSLLLVHFEELGEATKRYLGLLQNPYTQEQVIEKIAWRNAYDFTIRNFK